MANSLRAKIKKLYHDRKITEEDMNELIVKLDGHDRELFNKAIDDFTEKISLEISESLIWGILVDSNKDNNLNDTSDKIVDYVIETSKKLAEQLKAGEKND